MNQNENHIYFRELKKQDYRDVENIIRNTWHYDKISSSPRCAENMARLFLRSCLVRHTFSRVAVQNNQVIGIILGRSERSFKHPHPKNVCSQIHAILSLMISKERRRIANMFRGFDHIDKELLSSSGQKFDGELVLFAVDEKSRGLGIGKQLLQRLKSYMEEEQVKQLFLFTDTTCNYPFYESQGFKRLARKKCSLRPKINFEMEFYLYQYHFDLRHV